MLIRVAPTLFVNDGDLEERFVTAAGPGGQNVNKVATSVRLRFNLAACETLPTGVKARLAALAGRRLGRDGSILITAGRHRSQGHNREDAYDRLFALIRAAAIAPVERKPTRPTKASKTRRLEAKSHRAALKRLRRGGGEG